MDRGVGHPFWLGGTDVRVRVPHAKRQSSCFRKRCRPEHLPDRRAPESRLSLFKIIFENLAAESALFLSGDVHFGYVARASVNGHELAQVTSSPIKNELTGVEKYAAELSSGELGFGTASKTQRTRFVFSPDDVDGEARIIDIHDQAVGQVAQDILIDAIQAEGATLDVIGASAQHGDVVLLKPPVVTSKIAKLRLLILKLKRIIEGVPNASDIGQFAGDIAAIASDIRQLELLATEIESRNKLPDVVESTAVTPLSTNEAASTLHDLADVIGTASVVFPQLRPLDAVVSGAALLAKPFEEDTIRTDNNIALIWMREETSRAKLIPDQRDKNGFNCDQNVIEPLFSGQLTREGIKARDALEAKAKKSLYDQHLQILGPDALQVDQIKGLRIKPP